MNVDLTDLLERYTVQRQRFADSKPDALVADVIHLLQKVTGPEDVGLITERILDRVLGLPNLLEHVRERVEVHWNYVEARQRRDVRREAMDMIQAIRALTRER